MNCLTFPSAFSCHTLRAAKNSLRSVNSDEFGEESYPRDSFLRAQVSTLRPLPLLVKIKRRLATSTGTSTSGSGAATSGTGAIASIKGSCRRGDIGMLALVSPLFLFFLLFLLVVDGAARAGSDPEALLTVPSAGAGRCPDGTVEAGSGLVDLASSPSTCSVCWLAGTAGTGTGFGALISSPSSRLALWADRQFRSESLQFLAKCSVERQILHLMGRLM